MSDRSYDVVCPVHGVLATRPWTGASFVLGECTEIDAEASKTEGRVIRCGMQLTAESSAA